MVELYDSLASRTAREGAKEKTESYADTILFLLDETARNFPDEKKVLSLKKGYFVEKYYENRQEDAIKLYEEGIAGDDSTIDIYYLDRLARLYAAKPESKMKAIGILQKILDKDPNNATAQEYMKSLITDPNEYINVLRDAYFADSQSRQKLYELANAFYENIQAYDSAVVYFEKLTLLDPNVKNYWERLAKAQQFRGNYKAAVKAYEQVEKLDPTGKETMYNIAASLLQLGDLVKARAYAEKASAIDKDWGAPYMLTAQSYEAAVQRCVEGKRGGWDKMKVLDKAVYALAQDLYSLAARDPNFTDQARSRAAQLSTLIPTAEDLFVNKFAKGSTYKINSECYSWINRSVVLR